MQHFCWSKVSEKPHGWPLKFDAMASISPWYLNLYLKMYLPYFEEHEVYWVGPQVLLGQGLSAIRCAQPSALNVPFLTTLLARE